MTLCQPHDVTAGQLRPAGHTAAARWSHSCGPLVTQLRPAGHTAAACWSHSCGPLVTQPPSWQYV
eukprot:349919-Chlamydomonas_euryale.AAC.5